jgi:hypothetical protein
MLHPLPFTTFGEIAAFGLKATVYCPGCYDQRPIDANADRLRYRCFATARFKCTKIRYTGKVCGCLGSVEIEPCAPRRVGGNYNIAFLSCVTHRPGRSSWYRSTSLPGRRWTGAAAIGLDARAAASRWPGISTDRYGAPIVASVK